MSADSSPESSPAPVAHIDSRRLAFLRSLNPQQPDWLEKELVTPFLHEAELCRCQMQAALTTNNLSAVEKMAHDMASSCSMLGAQSLADHARRLMYAARANDPVVPAEGAKFLAALEVVIRELIALFPAAGAPTNQADDDAPG